TAKNLKLNTQSIEPHGYAIATASAVLNNSGDTIILEKDSLIVETLTYTTLEQGTSYARCDDIWIFNALPTEGTHNLCSEQDTYVVISPTQPQTTPPQATPLTTKNIATMSPYVTHAQKNCSPTFCSQTQQYTPNPHADQYYCTK
ncbi:MAG: hypothetical protein UZ22_OP11002000324, partial [Microgenomates bacterium OLB23]